MHSREHLLAYSLKTFLIIISQTQCGNCESDSVDLSQSKHRGEITFFSHKNRTFLVHIGRRRTASFNENDIVTNKNCEYNASSKKGKFRYCTKRMSLLAHPVYGITQLYIPETFLRR